MVKVYPTQIRGDDSPSDVLLEEKAPARGQRLADGRIMCGCGATVEDNGGGGLKPSCNFCWSAIEVVG